jgi:hypothetical protein
MPLCGIKSPSTSVDSRAVNFGELSKQAGTAVLSCRQWKAGSCMGGTRESCAEAEELYASVQAVESQADRAWDGCLERSSRSATMIDGRIVMLQGRGGREAEKTNLCRITTSQSVLL